MSNWISVTQQLPDSDISVLVFAPEDDTPVWLGYHDGEHWCGPDGLELKHPVTHWMEFPEPPAGWEEGAEAWLRWMAAHPNSNNL